MLGWMGPLPARVGFPGVLMSPPPDCRAVDGQSCAVGSLPAAAPPLHRALRPPQVSLRPGTLSPGSSGFCVSSFLFI